ncbi:MAG: tRNA threonylcarbamoyladenosine dehydratase [Armatimonadota bacterium]|nr:tRNA threonylcarbamoyladenosine dehydratase [bacterium]
MSRDERFRRVELMLGDEACERLRESFVVIVGLGAVGSYAVEGLARAGVGRIRVVDFDVVAPSNINRQLYALESTVGQLKCEVARKRILDINPSCNVEAINGFLDHTTAPGFIADSPDLVIDAIDSLNPKAQLIETTRGAGVPLIACLGAALRFDPTLVRVGPITEVHHCPLGRAVRKRLRRREVPMDFQCVFSEEPLPNPLPIARVDDGLADKPFLDRGRVRNTLGSMPTITGIFGLTAANLAIKMLIGK